MPAEATQVATLTTDLLKVQETESTPTHEQIATLAYRLWQERGCPDGSPDIDWYDAQGQLTTAKDDR